MVNFCFRIFFLFIIDQNNKDYKHQNSLKNVQSPTFDDLITPPKFFDNPANTKEDSSPNVFNFSESIDPENKAVTKET